MSITILEVLENADYNLQNQQLDIHVDIAKEQLHNALTALNNGYSLDDDYDEKMLSQPTPAKQEEKE